MRGQVSISNSTVAREPMTNNVTHEFLPKIKKVDSFIYR
jgi:hypothetical protein